MLKNGRQVIFTLLKLATLELFRSVSFTRNLLTGLFVFLVLGYFFIQLVGISIFLGLILRNYFDIQDIPSFLSNAAVYYLLAEFVFRFIIQKSPTLDFEKYLHLPIRRSGIVHFLLVRSLISLFSLVVIILFVPITISELSAVYGAPGATAWLGTLFFLSITTHWFILWIKQSVTGFLKGVLILCFPLLLFVLLYFELINLGLVTAPFFNLSFTSPIPLLISICACIIMYAAVHRVFFRNAYTEHTVERKKIYIDDKISLFSNYGLAGKLADTEIKMILRHKKSRGYLIVSIVLLLYGLFFYQSTGNGEPLFSAYIYLFVGAFITGSFVLQYGQLLLSWNSSYFDFFMVRKDGLDALIKSKYLIFLFTMIAAYILTLPYLYFGWEVIFYHSAALFYNAGIGVHLIIYMSLWEPKPMDINKGAMFNYDGVGIAQFIMIIPYILVMYALYFLLHLFFAEYGALIALGTIGLAGLIFQDKLLAISFKKLHRRRHSISNSFRQEL